LHQWESDREEFYKKYLSEHKRPWDTQGAAASVGSSFDAYVKCALHWHLFGNDGRGVFDLKRLFEEQVDEDCQGFAWRAGRECFERYQECGCYDELLTELKLSEIDPRFEFTLVGTVGGVTLKGKPDLGYKRVVPVVYDWKVMGYCSKSSVSPKKFYKTCRDTWTPEDKIKATRGGGEPKSHKLYEEIDWHGHKIGKHWMEDVDPKWADQTCIYSWLMGMEVGDENTITGIDQICCKPHVLNKGRAALEEPLPPLPPMIRVAQHRCRISESWQKKLLERLQDMWKTIQSGHIFDDLSREDSDSTCEVLDMGPPTNCDRGDVGALWDMCNERQYRG
jgi:hypothetical protein